MFCLLYVSKAVRPLDEEQLLDLLQTSREKNLRLQVTGLLLYKDAKFMQILEGEKEVIFDLFQLIARDSRHYDVINLLVENISTRQYSDWSMGFKNLNSIKPEEVLGYSDYMHVPLSLSEFEKNPSRAKDLMMIFRLG